MADVVVTDGLTKDQRWRLRHPGADAEKQRRYRARHPDRVYQQGKSEQQLYPGRRKARRAVNRALRNGNLIKPFQCDLCRNERPLQAHHDDYTRPLAVRWLCASCHKQQHNDHPTPVDEGKITTDGHVRGEKHPSAKLNAEDVRVIRERFAAGGMSKAALAREYGVTDVLIGIIIRREGWKHV